MSAKKIVLKRNDLWYDNIYSYDSLENREKLEEIGIQCQNMKHVLDSVGLATNQSNKRNLIFFSIYYLIFIILINFFLFGFFYVVINSRRYNHRDEIVIIMFTISNTILFFGLIRNCYLNLNARKIMRRRAKLLLDEENRLHREFKLEINSRLEIIITKNSDFNQITNNTPAENLLDINTSDLQVEKIFHIPFSNTPKKIYGHSLSTPIFVFLEPKLQEVYSQINAVYLQVIVEWSMKKICSTVIPIFVFFIIFVVLNLSFYEYLFLSRNVEIALEVILCVMSLVLIYLGEFYEKKMSESLNHRINSLNENFIKDGIFVDCRLRSYLIGIFVLNRGTTKEELEFNKVIKNYLE